MANIQKPLLSFFFFTRIHSMKDWKAPEGMQLQEKKAHKD